VRGIALRWREQVPRTKANSKSRRSGLPSPRVVIERGHRHTDGPAAITYYRGSKMPSDVYAVPFKNEYSETVLPNFVVPKIGEKEGIFLPNRRWASRHWRSVSRAGSLP